jgi:hypothetical protein
MIKIDKFHTLELALSTVSINYRLGKVFEMAANIAHTKMCEKKKEDEEEKLRVTRFIHQLCCLNMESQAVTMPRGYVEWKATRRVQKGLALNSTFFEEKVLLFFTVCQDSNRKNRPLGVQVWAYYRSN